MIQELTVSNYRSLGHDVRIKPGRVSFLVGPNGSGKSNVLDVVAFVRDAVIEGLPAALARRGGIDSVRRRSHGRPLDLHVGLHLRLDAGPAEYAFVLAGERLEDYRVKSEKAVVVGAEGKQAFHRRGSVWEGPPGLAPRMDDRFLALAVVGGTGPFKPLLDAISGFGVYAISPDALRVPRRFDPGWPMGRRGDDWTSVLHSLVRDEEARRILADSLNKLTGDIEDVRVAAAAGYLVAEFRQQAVAQKGKRWFEAAQQSDGTLRVAAMLTALLQRPPLPVIGLEEPERAIHPGALPMLYDHLHRAGDRSQVIVTTHSPLLLNLVDTEQDVILLVDRVDGKTGVERLGGTRLATIRNNLLRLGDIHVSGDFQYALFEEHE